LAKDVKVTTTGNKFSGVENWDGTGTNREFAAETTALLIHIAKEIASSSLSSEDREHFINTLGEFASDNLSARGLYYNFLDMLGPRLAEYAYYKKWVPTEGESTKWTLFHEYAKKVAFITSAGMNAMFNAVLSIFLQRQLFRWNLGDLIRG